MALDLAAPSRVGRPILKRRFGWILFAAALLVRLAYLALVPQPPVTFDARKYVAVALAAPLAIANPALWSDSTARAQIDFHLLYEDLIADEDVAWFPYAFPNYDDALNHLYAVGPVYPAFLGAIFRLTPHWDFWVVRVLQAMLDSLTVVLIWIVMSRLISAAGGIMAAGLWTVYGPAIYKCGELITETVSILLGVIILWLLIRAHERHRVGRVIVAGVLTGILTLTKASASALVVLLAVGWILANRRQPKWAAVGALGMLAASALVVAPWFLVIHWRYGVYAIRDPSYSGGNFRQANIVAAEGYNLDLAPDDFWTFPVWREMKAHPSDYLLLYLRKFYRTWVRASDEFRRGFPVGYAGTEAMQHLIVLLAVFGVFLWPTRAGPVAWLPVSFVAYFAGVHTVMHALSRYNLVAMPMLCGAAAIGTFWVLGDN
ncbi:MAG: glycosyltransferase family 39 protein, partial [candidate division Zixibacteria bacterium]|nr:glycosyltransferase family 39 protein [candidate division Zixibacteria bacterium]